jgi:hypothetical protein
MVLPALDLPFEGRVGVTGPGFVDARAQNSLPTANQPWPPIHYNPVNYDMRIWSAWWLQTKGPVLQTSLCARTTQLVRTPP